MTTAACASINVKVDPSVKDRAREVLGALGLDMTTAINLFLRQVIRCDGIPFELTNRSVAPAVDPRLVHRPVYVDGLPVLPVAWEEREDEVYDELYPAR